jgi:1-acyl-sn-glycerol-3-phosphate acyltransferase
LDLIKTILIFIPVVGAIIFLTPVGIVCLIGWFFGRQKTVKLLMHRIAQGWARMLIALSGCRITVTGRENIPLKGGMCFVSNHGSIFDILLILAYAGRPFGFIAKKELSYVPLLNMWIALLGGFFIDRKNARKALRTINKGIRQISSGDAMIIFPEGHRSRGQGLLPFHPGSLKLATQAGAPIVPVALAGSYDVFEKNYRLNSTSVGISFGTPIPTADLPPEDRKQRLADRTREIIGTMLEELGSKGRDLDPSH